MNNDSAASQASSRLRARLRAFGAMILLFGLAGAVAVYWMGSRAPEGMDGTDDRLLVGPSRSELHQVEFLYGKFGLRIIELMNGLKHPGTQAVIIAAASIVIALGCFYCARAVNHDDDTDRDGG